MRVVLDGRVANRHFPGIGRLAQGLAEALVRATPDIDFVVLEDTSTPASRRLAIAAPRAPVPASVFSIAQQWVVPKVLRDLAADVYHSLYYLMPYRPGVPSLLTCHDLIPLRLPGQMSPLRKTVFRTAHWLALRTADQVVAISDATRSDVAHEFGLDERRIEVVPHGVDQRFAPAAAAPSAALRARLGLPERHVLYVGINKPHKNLSMLIDAWGRLARSGPDRFAPTSPTTPGAPQDGRTSTPGTTDDSSPFALVIAGRWDPRYSAIRDQAAALAGAADIRFLGSVDEADLPALYSSAAAFVFPSRYEGFGLPPLEAMSCGTPVIAAAASSLPEVMGDAGILVGPDDPAGWAEAMGRVLTDPSVAADLRARGLVRAAQFTWRETARKTLEVYRALAGQGLG